MRAKELISDKIPPLRPNEDGKKALLWMQELCVDHLPVVDKNKYLGLVSMTEVLDMNNTKMNVADYIVTSGRSYVQPEVHFFEVIKLAIDYKLTLIPVVGNDGTYIGSITLNSILKYFASISSISDPGGIITIEMKAVDYSMTEIARIIESNNAKLMMSYISSNPDNETLDVTLKVNRLDLSHIISTFERYDFKVKESYQESEYYDDLKERFESLMKYLDI